MTDSYILAMDIYGLIYRAITDSVYNSLCDNTSQGVGDTLYRSITDVIFNTSCGAIDVPVSELVSRENMRSSCD